MDCLCEDETYSQYFHILFSTIDKFRSYPHAFTFLLRTASLMPHVIIPLCSFFFLKQNQLVDVCEKMQLQAVRIERFIDRMLTAREKAVQVPEEFTN